MERKERVLLLFFVILSAFMLYEARSFSRSASLFPQFAGTIVLVGSVFLFVKDSFSDRLPLPQKEGSGFTAGTETITDDPAEYAKTEERDEEEGATDAAESAMRFDIGNPAFVTAVMIVLYITSGYLLSLIYVTPIFVILYGIWFQLPRYQIIILTLLSIGVTYAFMSYALTPLDEGALLSIHRLPIQTTITVMSP